jgi:hypothetical protein
MTHEEKLVYSMNGRNKRERLDRSNFNHSRPRISPPSRPSSSSRASRPVAPSAARRLTRFSALARRALYANNSKLSASASN